MRLPSVLFFLTTVIVHQAHCPHPHIFLKRRLNNLALGRFAEKWLFLSLGARIRWFGNDSYKSEVDEIKLVLECDRKVTMRNLEEILNLKTNRQICTRKTHSSREWLKTFKAYGHILGPSKVHLPVFSHKMSAVISSRAFPSGCALRKHFLQFGIRNPVLGCLLRRMNEARMEHSPCESPGLPVLTAQLLSQHKAGASVLGMRV